MIVEDVKSLASEIYRSGSKAKLKFFPIFIDEFGSFASKEFIEVLKQIRSAQFGAHLFTQGLEDLDVVSKEFRRQASSNPLTKIAFRMGDHETVNELVLLENLLKQAKEAGRVQPEMRDLIRKLAGIDDVRKKTPKKGLSNVINDDKREGEVV